ncbi:MAG: hypothetical protein SFV51_20695 [Bryobacteraceae bacterium]|nr:hypothetical protein [Bryobacteraceae bacterium]
MSGAPLPVEIRSLAILVLAINAIRISGYGFERHLPMLAFLDSLGTPAQWDFALRSALFAGAAMSWFPRLTRIGAFLGGGALVLRILGNMPMFSNGILFSGLLLILISLYAPPHGWAILRAQCVILYAGAALSKCLDPDWLNGRFTAVMLDYHVPALAGTLRPLTPLAGILTIATEAAIAILLAIPRLRRFGIALSVLFHSFLLLLLKEDFGSFYYTVTLSAVLLFLSLPDVRAVAAPSPFWSSHSVFTGIRQAPLQKGAWAVEFPDFSLKDFPARLFLALSSLPVLGGVLGVAAMLGYLGRMKPRSAILAVIFAAGVFVWISSTTTTPKRG